MIKQLILPIIAMSFFATACAPSAPDGPSDAEIGPKTLTVYSSRHYDSDRILYESYEEATGVHIDVREAKADQLLETMKAEGENSPADIIIAADAGALWRFQNAGLTQAYSDAEIEAAIPPNFRQSDGHWFGLGKRIRVVAYDPTRFTQSDVDAWADLTTEDKRGEICVRSSSNIYNLSLLAEMIARTGRDQAGAWAAGIVANMARRPQGGDTDQIRAVAAGQCGIAIVNHYYWVRLKLSPSETDRAEAAATRLVIPTFPDNAGAHVNITGVAITSMTDNVALAADFIKYLLTQEGQELLTTETKELPIISTANLPDGVDALPPFSAAATQLDILGENQAEAQRLYDLAGWN